MIFSTILIIENINAYFTFQFAAKKSKDGKLKITAVFLEILVLQLTLGTNLLFISG